MKKGELIEFYLTGDEKLIDIIKKNKDYLEKVTDSKIILEKLENPKMEKEIKIKNYRIVAQIRL